MLLWLLLACSVDHQVLDIDGRKVPVWMPADHTSDEGDLPLLVSLHGYTVQSWVHNLYWDTSAYVPEGRFVLATPRGEVDSVGNPYWNATDLCCDFDESGVDDEQFLLDLLDTLEADYPVDPDRIYFAGHSNGGFMSTTMACRHADRIAAFASLAGSGWSEPELCEATGPIDVLQIHGTDDATIPYEDSEYPGAETMMARWVERNGCDTDASSGTPLDIDGSLAGEETTVKTWTGCDDDVEVSLWTIEGGAHAPRFAASWPEPLWDWLSER